MIYFLPEFKYSAEVAVFLLATPRLHIVIYKCKCNIRSHFAIQSCDGLTSVSNVCFTPRDLFMAIGFVY